MEQMTRVSDIISLMEQIAPSRLAESWDNAGLQVGDPSQKVSRVLVALEPCINVIQAACKQSFDMLITHHPMIFKPIKSLDTSAPKGKAIKLCIESGLAVYCAHTNLDSVQGGLCDLLARKAGLKDPSPFLPAPHIKTGYLVLYLVQDDFHAVLSDLRDSLLEPAGNRRDIIVSTAKAVSPGSLDNETLKHGARTSDELLKVMIDVSGITPVNVSGIVDRLQLTHPGIRGWEIIDAAKPVSAGIGRVGITEPPVSLKDLAERLAGELGISHVRIAGDPAMITKRVLVCSGSVSSLVPDFLSSDADVLVGGDLRYHDAIDAVDAGKGLIDVGHFASERIVIPVLVSRLRSAAARAGMNIAVEAHEGESDPFVVKFFC